ncbi:Gfo/Idh/MocA family oxidoreductase [Telmatospirillum sp.]|uniref:Gfo/Idh/MocA family protein n=1 Tax=Telmatospirillum sp. TaxID=2079197 RepID=UPI00284507C3|nr:Gfo/Idh/MocA family oxidoreductase [Telmatospirillum sp.]MDR3436580.1 Gfo/Idh/MocA family oxidoreductase [Telmatospirillum sp.]
MNESAQASVRLLVVGAGLIGQVHIRSILGLPEAKLVGIVDDAPHIQKQAAELGVPWGTDLEPMLRACHPDGVIVSVPNQFHFSVGMTLLRHRLPMLMEKPVCDTVSQAREFADAAEQAGVAVLAGHHRRHGPTIQRAKEIIASGRLGRISAVHGFCWVLKPKDYFEGKGAWRAQPGGGVVLINLIHVIDDLRNLCGEIASVQAAASNAARGFPVEDTIGIILTFRSGAIGTLAVSDAAASPWSWELTSGENKAFPHTAESCYLVAGMEASLSIPRLEIWHHGAERSWWSPIHADRVVAPEADAFTLKSHADPMVNEMRHFCDVVRGRAEPLLDARGGARTLEATLAVVEAARSGKAVMLS